MKKIILSLFAIFSVTGMFAEDPVLMRINGKDVHVSEFLYIYQKNNQETSFDQKSIDEYVDLFVNFKLKVAEAEAQKLDTTTAFAQELAGYRAQATPKYMQDEQAIDSLVRLSYAHMKMDRRAAHIAVQCARNASPEEEAEAIQKIEDARARITGTKTETRKDKKGRTKTITLLAEDFATVAREISTDPSAGENGGELGWITPFRYVWPFEKAVYETPVGSVTPVFRTAYGFHIALVEEECPHEEVHAAHIMKMTGRGDETQRLKQKVAIDSIVPLLTSENFAEMAKKMSDDKGSAARGGDLNWFGKGMMVKPFEDAVFGMQVGQISQPVESQFGWHIIYLMDKRELQPLDSMYQNILRNVKRDERMKEADEAFVERARKEYNLPNEMSSEDVRQYADAHLEDKYEDLKHLVREYHDGILLFEVSLREVWDKASKDEQGLTSYFNANRQQYNWNAPRYKGWLVQCKDKASMQAAKAIIRNSDPDSIENYLSQRLMSDSTSSIKYQKGLWEQGSNKAVDKYGFKKKNAEYTPSEEYPYVICIGRVTKNPEEYTDERGKVVTDYQDYLEKAWIETLRSKYDVQIYQDVLDSIKH